MYWVDDSKEGRRVLEVKVMIQEMNLWIPWLHETGQEYVRKLGEGRLSSWRYLRHLTHRERM
jgi:hypothetical protein